MVQRRSQILDPQKDGNHPESHSGDLRKSLPWEGTDATAKQMTTLSALSAPTIRLVAEEGLEPPTRGL